METAKGSVAATVGVGVGRVRGHRIQGSEVTLMGVPVITHLPRPGCTTRAEPHVAWVTVMCHVGSSAVTCVPSSEAGGGVDRGHVGALFPLNSAVSLHLL